MWTSRQPPTWPAMYLGEPLQMDFSVKNKTTWSHWLSSPKRKPSIVGSVSSAFNPNVLFLANPIPLPPVRPCFGACFSCSYSLPCLPVPQPTSLLTSSLLPCQLASGLQASSMSQPPKPMFWPLQTLLGVSADYQSVPQALACFSKWQSAFSWCHFVSWH